MEEVDVLIYFIRPILKEACIRIKMMQNKVWFKVSTRMARSVLFIMLMTIIFVLLDMNLFQKTDKIQMVSLNFLNYPTNKINFI